MTRSLYDIFAHAPKSHISAIATLLGVSEQELIECCFGGDELLPESQDSTLETKTYRCGNDPWRPKLKNGHINQDVLPHEQTLVSGPGYSGLITIRTALQGLKIAVWDSLVPEIRPNWKRQDWMDAWHKSRIDHLLIQAIHSMLRRDWQKARLEGQCEAAKIFDYNGECNPIEYLNSVRQNALENESAVNEFCVAFHKCGITVPDDELKSDAIAEFIESRFDECISEFEDAVAKAMSEVVSEFRIRKED